VCHVKSLAFYKLVYFRLILGYAGRIYIVSDAGFIKIEDEICKSLNGESILMNYLLHFLKNTKVH